MAFLCMHFDGNESLFKNMTEAEVISAVHSDNSCIVRKEKDEQEVSNDDFVYPMLFTFSKII